MYFSVKESEKKERKLNSLVKVFRPGNGSNVETKEGGIKADSAVEHRRMIHPERTGKPKVVEEKLT